MINIVPNRFPFEGMGEESDAVFDAAFGEAFGMQFPDFFVSRRFKGVGVEEFASFLIIEEGFFMRSFEAEGMPLFEWSMDVGKIFDILKACLFKFLIPLALE